MRMLLLSGVTVLAATPALAGDRYQLIPSRELGSRPTYHELIVIDELSGDLFSCSVRMTQGEVGAVGKLERLLCRKGRVTEGAVPPGAAVMARSQFNFTVSYPALWKIDQETGTLTFCGAIAEPLGSTLEWRCSSAPLTEERTTDGPVTPLGEHERR